MIAPAMLKDRFLHGESTALMRRLPAESVDLIVTDPPYLVNYRDRNGRRFLNDDPRKPEWLLPAFEQMYRVLKQDSICVCFYGWNRVDLFMPAWKAAGFRPAGHLVWCKHYASSHGLVAARHECAYVLAKGRPKPNKRLADIQPWGDYTGNRLHPCQKPESIFAPVIDAFSRPGDLVLDPFAGSAPVAKAARALGRHYLVMELDWDYYQIAHRGLEKGAG